MQKYFKGMLNDREAECVSAIYGTKKIIQMGWNKFKNLIHGMFSATNLQ